MNIKRFFLLCLVVLAGLEAKDITPFINDFKAEKYSRVCEKGMREYYGGYTDENFVSLVGVACAKVDRINILGMLQRSQVESKDARENASYFASLILQKRLIYQFMIDDLSLKNLRLPASSHLLSRVFEKLSANEYTVLSTSPKLIELNDNGRKIMLSTSDDEPIKVLVDEYSDEGVLKRHWYQ